MLTSWRRLKNNRAELMLTFVVPILFFSIFAVIFGSRGSSNSGSPRIKIALADEVQTPQSAQALEALSQQPALWITGPAAAPKESSTAETAATVTKQKAEDLVRRGMVSAAVIIVPSGVNAKSNGAPWSIKILADSYDQVTSQVLAALVQRAVLSANTQATQAAFANERSSPIPTSIPANSLISHSSVAPASFVTPTASATTQSASANLSSIDVVDVLGGKKANPVTAMYAAGIAVMFLLFSATTASGSLLEERENSTLDRLLCSRLTMDQLLLGKWAFLTTIGFLQMTLMFGWGSLVFGIELVQHLEGFIAMTIVTSGASASFALLLASMCRTRVQLGWVSTIVILSMSALGGSMFPRYLMSESIQRAGLVTFNAWALEGYNKIFWRDLHLRDIAIELAVLAICGLSFIALARLFAVRWERT